MYFQQPENSFEKVFQIILIGIQVLMLPACTSNNNDNAVNLSGSISVFEGSTIDSDVNDPNASYQPNDTPAQAQPISFPLTLGGYVNQPNAGNSGRSFATGDINDYFETNLFQGQKINLFIANIGNLNNPTNNLDLFLYDETGTILIASSNTQTKQESIVINQDGNYIIRVSAITGASIYNMTVGFDVGSFSVLDQPLIEDRDFVPGQVIVRFHDNAESSSVQFGNSKPTTRELSLASELGMQHTAGKIKREMLLSIDDLDASFTALGISGSNLSKNKPLGLDLNLEQRKQATLEIVKALRAREDVKFASPNYIVRAAQVPNDADYELQWHYPFINLPQAWDVTTGAGNVIVAVIDTGVLLDHPDLQGQLVAGYDFILNRDGIDNERDNDPGIDNDPNDPGDGINGPSSYHGTHVAGTIAAATDNALGAAGIAWGAKIMPLRVLGPFDGTVYDIGQAVRFAAGLPNDSGTVPAQRADIINLSLGGKSTVEDLESFKEPFQQAREAGVIIIAAAGNDGENTLYFPSSIDGVVSVSAVNINRQLASYSNFGSTVDISAPGGDSGDVNGDGFFDGVYSLSADVIDGQISYTNKFSSGTSMATPHVAGVAALMKSVFPGMTPDLFDQLLQTNSISEDIGAQGRDDLYGYGLLDASLAIVSAINAEGGVIPQRDPLAIADPVALNFSFQKNSHRINIRNAGDGQLNVLSVVNDSGGWLNVEPVNNVADGLGEYDVVVDRSSAAVSARMAKATITITTDANTITIPVIVQMEQVPYSNQVGIQYVLLLDQDQQAIYEARVSGNSNIYNYSFNDITPGIYYITAGSDLNNDNLICDPGEACGEFPVLFNSRPIVVQGGGVAQFDLPLTNFISRADTVNANFDVGFRLNFGTTATTKRPSR